MSKREMKIKISTAINLISLLSLISILLLSFIGYKKITALKDSIENMYNSDVQQVVSSRTITAKASELQLNVLKQTLDYNQSLDSEINENISELTQVVNAYIEGLPEEEKNNGLNLIETVKQYGDVWYTI